MNLKKLLKQTPMVLALFLMGCSYGCDPKNKADSELEENAELDEPAISDFDEDSADEPEDAVNEEELEDAAPVVPSDEEDDEDSGFDEDLYGRGDEIEEEHEAEDEGEDLEEESSKDYYGGDPELDPEEEGENYESEEEEYIDDGEVYEDEYPG